MTKDELKQLSSIRADIDILKTRIVKAEEEYYKHHENRKRFTQTIMMSSTDEACRVIESRVDSSSISTEESQAKRNLDILTAKLANTKRKESELKAEIEPWLETLPDWRIRTILQLRYIDGYNTDEIATCMRYDNGSIRNIEYQFWKNK